MHHLSYSIQTELERRRREAGVQQGMEHWLRSCLCAVCVCRYVFKDCSRFKALSETKVIPLCSPVDTTLLGYNITGCGS